MKTPFSAARRRALRRLGFAAAAFATRSTGSIADGIEANGGGSERVIRASEFGALGDGYADDTPSLSAAFDFAVSQALALELEGHYRVTGPILPYVKRKAGSLRLICKGAVKIVVDANAAPFTDLIYVHTSEPNSSSFIGEALLIDLNQRCARGISVRHESAEQSGSIDWTAPVTVLSAFNHDARDARENQAIAITGDYKSIALARPIVRNVGRTNPAGACKGIAISGVSGRVMIDRPVVERVLCPPGANDADGIAIFGKIVGDVNAARGGSANVIEPLLIDCQGRSLKSQCSDVTVLRPRVRRRAVVSIEHGHDFDFQFGNGVLIEPDYEYRLNEGASPLGRGFSPVAFQQRLEDRPMLAQSLGGALRTEANMRGYCVLIDSTAAQRSDTEIDGLEVSAVGKFQGPVFSRAFIETDAGVIASKTERTTIRVRNISGPLGCPIIGYTGFFSWKPCSTLAWEVAFCANTSSGGAKEAFRALSGLRIPGVADFFLRGNSGVSNEFVGRWVFDFETLKPSCVFTVDLSAVAASNAPDWGTSGRAVIEALEQPGASGGEIRVTVTRDGGERRIFSRRSAAWSRDHPE